jgi:hypothetical protein
MFDTPFQSFSKNAAKDSADDQGHEDNKKPSKTSTKGGAAGASSRSSDDVEKTGTISAKYDGTYVVDPGDGTKHYHPNHADAIQHLSEALSKESTDGQEHTKGGPSASKVSKHHEISGEIAR